MKKFNIIKLAVLGLAASCLAFTSCKDEVEAPAKAVEASVDEVTFVAVDAPEQTISVYADGTWKADVAEDWITVSPMSGVGNTDVVITVTNNVSGGILDTPRQGQVLFMGSSFERKGKLVVNQKGDKYKGIDEVTVSGAAALEEGGVAKVNDAQVVAVSKMGFVVSDGTTNLYVVVKEKATDLASADVKVGDVIFLNGEKIAFNGVPAFKLDEYEVKSSGASSSASAKDITSSIDSYKADASEFVKVDGSVVYGVLRIAGASKRVNILDPLDEFGIDNLNIHKLTVTGYYAGVKDGNINVVINSVKDNGLDEGLVPYPVIWAMGAGAKASGVLNYTTESFAANSSFESIQGLGTISYVPALGDDGKPLKNDNSKYALDVSGDNPRVTGPWPGDYWLFTGLGQVKAGSKMRIIFESRVSATGHKFWQLEYKDGDVWKVAGELQKTSEPGSAITFTHAMAADGATNIHVDETVTFNHNSDNCQFRFRCMANWQASGAGALGARNGGTARLAVTDVTEAGVENWPHLYMMEEGDGVDRPDTDPVYANIVVSEDVLAFEGTPAAPIKLTVKSDYDFTVAADVEWLSVDVAEGAAGEDVDIMVTCEPTTLSNLRQGNIKISSADSRKLVPVVQSAAGQDLDPFVALGSNSADITYKAQTVKVKLQYNAEYTITSDVDWISLEPETKGLVEKTEEKLYVSENTDTQAPRVGHVTFAIEGKNIESVFTVTQAAKPSTPSTTIFEEDFEWLADFEPVYTAATNKTFGQTVEKNDANATAPNLYTTESLLPLAQELVKRGYEDINPSGQVVYPQHYYLKFGKTSVHSGLKLPAIDYTGDAVISFDWCPMMTGSGNIDKVNVVVEVVGGGTIDGKTVSAPAVNDWAKKDLKWKRIEYRIDGLTPSSRIIIRPEYLEDHDGVTQMRFFLDNIKVDKAKAAPKVIFQDDFSWLQSLIDEYNSANSTPIGNSVTGYAKEDYKGASSANAPNAYTAEPFKSKFADALAAAGYEDMNPSAKVIYPQDCYLKFGKTSAHTSPKIKALPLTEASELTVEFDWCRHVQGDATVDPVTLTLVITGDGMFENGTKYSDPLETPQTFEKDAWAEMGWTHANVKIEGANANTQINIVYTDCLNKETGEYNWKVSGAHRFHLDNIVITKY